MTSRRQRSRKPCKSNAGTCVITPPARGRAPRRSDGQTPRGKIFAASAAIHSGAQWYLHEVRYVPGYFVGISAEVKASVDGCLIHDHRVCIERPPSGGFLFAMR
jgi:hypothetical protein